jgi:hypothetical protein
MLRRILPVFFAVALGLLTAPAIGGMLTPAFNPTGGFDSTGEWPVPSLAANQFRVTTSGLYARALGVYDSLNDGLLTGRPVGLFDVATRQKLAEVEVPAGASAQLTSGFRYIPIPAVELISGRTYQVVTLNDGPGIEAREGMSPSISVALATGLSNFRTLLDIRPPNNELGVATDSSPVTLFGPNLLIGTVPEPAAVVSALIGAALASVGRRRR